LHTILSQFWIMFRQEFPVPRVGPDELKIFAVLVAIATFIHRGGIVEIAGHWLGWADMAAAVLIPLYVVHLTVSATRLYRQMAEV